MQWIQSYNLFLFDFDGLLVNTEHIHYQAYVNVLNQRGVALDLNFVHFCKLAQLNSTAWKEALCSKYPDLEAHWAQIYQEKKGAYLELVTAGKIELMPGVESLLKALQAADIRRCVVTNSPLEQTKLICAHLPILKSIPKWVTREDYEKPKPDPECYLKAIELYGKKGDKIIGFEDSVRGLSSLRQTSALPVLICPTHHPLLEIALAEGGRHFESFESISFE